MQVIKSKGKRQKAKGRNGVFTFCLSFVPVQMLFVFIGQEIIISLCLLFVAFCFLIFVFFLLSNHHAKAKNTPLDLIGKTAIVHSELNPKGTVLSNGDLWFAESYNQRTIEIGRKVKIVGTNNHLLEVDLNEID